MRWTDKHHGNILCSRRKQTRIWDSLSSKEIAKQIILKAKRKYKYKVKYLRIHESGDFRNQRDVNKMSRIAEYLKVGNIRVYGYSARNDLKYNNLSDNLVLNGSYFKIDNMFVPVHNYTEGKVRCLQNCRICNLCKEKRGITIENKFHGVTFNKLKG